MKQVRRVLMALFVLGAVVLCGGRLAEPGETVVVKIKKYELRDAPRFLARTGAEVLLSDRLLVEERRDYWYRVSGDNGKQGWVHDSAVSARRVKLSTEGAGATSDLQAEEAFVAVKGFNENVEREHRRSSAHADFAAVDRMTRLRIDSQELRQFMRSGRLGGR